MLIEQVHQQFELLALVDFEDEEVHVFGRLGGDTAGDTDRVRDVFLDEVGNRLLDGGREEHGLAFFGEFVEDDTEGGQETHVEHAVSFVENNHAGLREIHQIAVEEVDEATRGGDDDFGTLPDIGELLAFGKATDHDSGLDARAFVHLLEGLFNLDGEFAGGAKDEGLDGLRARHCIKRFEDGDGESEGLAGAGLGGGDHVISCHQVRDGLGLDGSRGDKVVLREIGLECGAKVEFCK